MERDGEIFTPHPTANPVGAQKNLEFSVAEHRRHSIRTARRIVAATAAAASATVLVPSVANASEVTVPGTGISAEVAGIENIPGIADVPGIEAWIPSLAGQAGSGTNAQAAIDQARALPMSSAIPGFTQFLNQAESEVAYSAPVVAPAAVAAPAPAAPAPAPAPAASSTGQAIADAALSKIGSPYGWGATGPYAFDCSGLTSWAYAQAGKSIPRTSQAQAASGTPVPLSQLQPGDLIAYYGGASHVAVYVGNGMMVDALNSSSPVAQRPIDYMPIHSAFRF